MGMTEYTWAIVGFMVFNATFNNISAIPRRSVLLVEENGVPGENHRPAASNWQTSSHNVVSSTPPNERDTNSQRYWWWALIAYYMITITTSPSILVNTYISFI